MIGRVRIWRGHHGTKRSQRMVIQLDGECMQKDWIPCPNEVAHIAIANHSAHAGRAMIISKRRLRISNAHDS